jgi:hypothetical protein
MFYVWIQAECHVVRDCNPTRRPTQQELKEDGKAGLNPGLGRDVVV